MTTEDTQTQPPPQNQPPSQDQPPPHDPPTPQDQPHYGNPPRSYPPVSALRRSRSDRKVAGVSGGLGRYAGVDPLIFRILFVVLTFFGGSGILLYALAWLLVAEDGAHESEGQRLLNGRSTSSASKVIALVVVIVLGLAAVGALLDTGAGLGGLGALVVIGVIVVLLLRGGQRPVTGQAPYTPAYGPVPPPEPGAFGQTPGTAYAPASPTSPAYMPPGPPSYPTSPHPYRPEPPAPPREKSVLGRVTVSSALIVVGLLVGWNSATDRDVSGAAVLACALAVVGAGLVVGAFRGRARGLVFLGVVLAIATSVAAAATDTFEGGTGDRSWAPTSVSALQPVYDHGAGDAELDLSALTFSPGDQVRVRTSLGAGELTVILPATASVEIDAQVGVGHLQVLEEGADDGPGLEERVVDPVGVDAPVIVLDAEVGVGALEVRRATS